MIINKAGRASPAYGRNKILDSYAKKAKRQNGKTAKRHNGKTAKRQNGKTADTDGAAVLRCPAIVYYYSMLYYNRS